MATASKLKVNEKASDVQMAEAIFGDGVTVVSASYSGEKSSSGIYSKGDETSPGVTPGDSGVILSTGEVSDFTQKKGDPNQETNTSSDTDGENNLSDFNTIAGGVSTYDAAYLDVDFIPTGDVMTIRFVFSSEEYPEYSNSIYNDVVGVWANGVHIPISVTDSAASVTEINPTENINLYKDNTGDAYNTEMDGFTVTMTLTIPVNAGVVNSIRIGIADTGDSNYDSNLLIAGDSIQTTLIAVQDDYVIAPGDTQNVDVTTNDLNSTGGTLEVTHINGNAVSAGDTITLPSGQTVTLLADGTFDITADLDAEKVSFTYAVDSVDGSGNVLQTDTGFVTVDSVPCFVAGTLIRTPNGDTPVEKLCVGDLVVTLDDGPQPLRWIGQRSVPATGKMAPIAFARNAIGEHDPLMLSPQHRVLVRNTLASLLFGEDDVLVAARQLINDVTIRPAEGGDVTYVHLMFDKHQVIWSAGLLTESFLPGPQMTKSFERDLLDEIRAIFPELCVDTGNGYSKSARRTLKPYEARAMLRSVA